jgi:hypothetical protein
MNAFLRYLIAIGIGIGGTLAWQAHGEVAKHMAADWAAQHGGLWLGCWTGRELSRAASLDPRWLLIHQANL